MSKKLIISKEHRLTDLTGVGKTIRPLVKQILGKNAFIQIELMENWDEIVGEKLCRYVLPQKISFNKDERTNGTLFLTVFGGAYAMEVENNKLKILQKINTFFGYEAVDKLKILQNNNIENFLGEKNMADNLKKNLVSENEKNYISEMLYEIENENLRLKLESLGKAVLKNKKEGE